MKREEILIERVVLVSDALCWRATGRPIKGFYDRDGYHRFTIGAGKHGRVHHFASHRAVWFLTHGKWPRFEIDHINRIRADNRIANLRDVPRAVNRSNTVRPEKYNSSAKSQCPAMGASRRQYAPASARPLPTLPLHGSQ